MLHCSGHRGGVLSAGDCAGDEDGVAAQLHCQRGVGPGAETGPPAPGQVQAAHNPLEYWGGGQAPAGVGDAARGGVEGLGLVREGVLVGDRDPLARPKRAGLRQDIKLLVIGAVEPRDLAAEELHIQVGQ